MINWPEKDRKENITQEVFFNQPRVFWIKSSSQFYVIPTVKIQIELTQLPKLARLLASLDSGHHIRTQQQQQQQQQQQWKGSYPLDNDSDRIDAVAQLGAATGFCGQWSPD